MSDYDFTNIVREVALSENIQDCKLEQKYSTNKGDGYSGIVKAVQLAGSNKTIDVVMKYIRRNKQAHETKFPLRKVYLNEIKFYEVIEPAFAKFQTEHNITDPFNNTPRLYTSVKEPFNELLVFEDLKVHNYDLWNRKQLMNKPHLEYAVKTLGKFHGLSFAMQEINPKAYNELISIIDSNLYQSLIETMSFFKQLRQSVEDCLCIFDPITEKHYWDRMKKFTDNVEDVLSNAVNYHEDDIILQGDCWCNNMMFQYEDMDDRTTPKDMKLLDFQVMRLGSPMIDLSNFFYTIAPKESFDNEGYFLKMYHDSMTEHMKKFNVNADQIFPYQKLLKHWEICCKYGFVLSFCVRKAMLMKSEDAPEFTDNPEDFLSRIQLDADKEKTYHQQMRELAMHFMEKNII